MKKETGITAFFLSGLLTSDSQWGGCCSLTTRIYLKGKTTKDSTEFQKIFDQYKKNQAEVGNVGSSYNPLEVSMINMETHIHPTPSFSFRSSNIWLGRVNATPIQISHSELFQYENINLSFCVTELSCFQMLCMDTYWIYKHPNTLDCELTVDSSWYYIMLPTNH